MWKVVLIAGLFLIFSVKAFAMIGPNVSIFQPALFGLSGDGVQDRYYTNDGLTNQYFTDDATNNDYYSEDAP